MRIYKQQDRSDGNIKALRNGMDSSMDNLRNRMQGIAESLRGYADLKMC